MNKKELEKLYWSEKLSISEIAQKLGVSYWFVWQRMNKWGIKRRNLSEANTLNNLSRKIIIPESVIRELYIHKKLPVTKIAEVFNCHHSVILRRMKEFGIKSREWSEANTLYPKHNFSGDLIEKAYLLGFRAGDLYVCKPNKTGKTIRIEGNSTKLSQINLIKNLFGRYGRFVKYKLKGFREDDFWHSYCLVNNTFDFLLRKEKTIPRWILNNKKYFSPFLAGYIDAEGSIKIYGNKGCIKQVRFILASYDKTILSQIRERLISIGIKCGRLRINSPKGYRTKRKPLPYKEDYYGFGIYSKKSLLQLFDCIQDYLKHPDRVYDLERTQRNIKWRNEKFGNLRMK